MKRIAEFIPALFFTVALFSSCRSTAPADTSAATHSHFSVDRVTYALNGSGFMDSDPGERLVYFGGATDTLHATEYALQVVLSQPDTGYRTLGPDDLMLIKRSWDKNDEQVLIFHSVSGTLHVMQYRPGQTLEARFDAIAYDPETQDSLVITNGYFRFGK